MSDIVVSVIIPTYNRANLLVGAIRSVLAQSYRDFEIIVSDDGSTDDTKEAIAKFGDKVKYIYNENSGLPSVARNAGLNIANGKYIAFLDSDDLWLPDKLNTQSVIMENNPSVGMVCSNAIIYGNDSLEKRYLEPGQGKSGDVFSNLLKNNFIITSTCLIRKDILEQLGRFTESRLLRGIEDYDLWLRVARTWNVIYIDEPLVYYRDIPRESIRSNQDAAQYLKGLIIILDGYRETHLDPAAKKELNLNKGLHRKDLMLYYLQEKRIGLFAFQLMKLILRQPYFFLRWVGFESRQLVNQLWGDARKKK